jgi:hypothetical protein
MFDLTKPMNPDAPSTVGAVMDPVGIASTGDKLHVFQCSAGGQVDTVDSTQGTETSTAMKYFPANLSSCAFSGATQQIFGIEQDGFHITAQISNDRFTTYFRAQMIAAGPESQRLLAVSAGTSSLTAGLTAIDPGPTPDLGNFNFPSPENSIIQYPTDPITHERYQPSRIAILNGR